MDRLALTTNARKIYQLFVVLSISLTPILQQPAETLSLCVTGPCVFGAGTFCLRVHDPGQVQQLWQLYRFFLLFSGSELTRLNVVIRIIANRERDVRKLLPYCCSSVAGDQLGPLFWLYNQGRQLLNRNERQRCLAPNHIKKSRAYIYVGRGKVVFGLVAIVLFPFFFFFFFFFF